MGRELEKYIKDSLEKGVNQETLRYNLQSAGWSEDQIEEGLRKAQRNNSKVVVSLFLLLVIVGVGASFVFLFTNLENIATPTTNGNTDVSSCDILPNGESKIDCYSEKVKTSYNCEDITSQTEKLYCLRALENHYLSQA